MHVSPRGMGIETPMILFISSLIQAIVQGKITNSALSGVKESYRG